MLPTFAYNYVISQRQFWRWWCVSFHIHSTFLIPSNNMVLPSLYDKWMQNCRVRLTNSSTSTEKPLKVNMWALISITGLTSSLVTSNVDNQLLRCNFVAIFSILETLPVEYYLTIAYILDRQQTYFTMWHMKVQLIWKIWMICCINLLLRIR